MFLHRPTPEAMAKLKELIDRLEKEARAIENERREHEGRRIAEAMAEIAKGRERRIAASRAIDPR